MSKKYMQIIIKPSKAKNVLDKDFFRVGLKVCYDLAVWLAFFQNTLAADGDLIKNKPERGEKIFNSLINLFMFFLCRVYLNINIFENYAKNHTKTKNYAKKRQTTCMLLSK